MSMTPRPPIPSFIPESAPFTPEQRTWLNGLFAGVFGLQESITPLSGDALAKLLPGLDVGAAAPAEEDDGAPWHDPSMPLADRMKLAEGKALPRRMMAAMAQQDCGQCGYNCKDYADKLFDKSEKRLNLCVPGGKETNAHAQATLRGDRRRWRCRRRLCAPEAAKSVAPATPAGRSRDNPALRHLPLAPPSQPGRLREGDMAYRDRPRPAPISTTRSATRSAFIRPMMPRWSTP